jgi:hypothetical protein
VESTADERNVGDAVEVAEHPHAVYHDHIGIPVSSGAEARRGKPACCEARLECGKVGCGRFVRRDHEANAGFGDAHSGEGRKEHAFIGRPGGSCHHCRTVARERREKR